MSNASMMRRRPNQEDVPADPTYDGDFHAWALHQAERLRAGDVGALDLQHLAEEIESVGRSEFNALVANLAIILQHMLKWDHQPAKQSRSWALSIDEHRDRVGQTLEDNLSLKARWDEAVERAYRSAVRMAAQETQLRLRDFPAACPYSPTDILDRPFPVDQD